MGRCRRATPEAIHPNQLEGVFAPFSFKTALLGGHTFLNFE
jgi:hypothetical protein